MLRTQKLNYNKTSKQVLLNKYKEETPSFDMTLGTV